ncbi:cytochrome P450 [Pontibrevibacter nitratireducens]|uniref:Cytochrome P450 n=1 Tax=Pontivivens nitratireducens TaxID=2758038 RepID=A0A6G7VPY3_9RHOB|nr:cytochrome P450 [Pontibrevibacter nitratireducens]QIK42099.1 cytochrome P450 [Pontibrevibacter nitratireducens]
MPRLSQSPRDPAFVQNPYPFYDKLRAAGPLVVWDELSMPVAAGHAEVNALLRDRRFGRENPFPMEPEPHVAPFYEIDRLSLLDREPPEHTRLRRLITRAFTPRTVEAMIPDIQSLSNSLLDDLEPGDDLLAKFCERLPVIVICRLLGVPEDRADDLLRWSHDMVAMYQIRRDRRIEDTAVASTQAFRAFLETYLAERRAAPRDDLISALIAAEEDGEKLSAYELIATCILLLNAGHEATVHALGNGIRTLVQTGQWHAHDPAKLTEEILRHDPPLHLFSRYAMQDVEVFGHSFAKGEQVGLLLAAANRDPAVWTDPARFDPTREPGPQLALGAGLHFCIGGPLARLEISIALPILIDRLPELELAETAVFADRWHFHGLERLPVTFRT